MVSANSVIACPNPLGLHSDELMFLEKPDETTNNQTPTETTLGYGWPDEHDPGIFLVKAVVRGPKELVMLDTAMKLAGEKGRRVQLYYDK